jgi:hypothetical protein
MKVTIFFWGGGGLYVLFPVLNIPGLYKLVHLVKRNWRGGKALGSGRFCGYIA